MTETGRETIDFGIDLGTTNSAIAVADAGEARVIKNNDGWDCTPSAVWMPRLNVVHVGRAAKDHTHSDPDDAVAEFKLKMGLAGAGTRFAAAGVTLTPQQLSAEVLKSLRGDAEHHCGAAPEAAVITVPAAFALNQSNATGEAAQLAGFSAPCPLLQEPTAAAFAYGFREASDNAYWMVFDFGGGTFDAAVVSKRDGELEVLNHAGDPTLGGKLIDWAVVEQLLAPAAARTLGLVGFSRENSKTNQAWRHNFAKLKHAAEEAKIHLSRRQSTVINLDLKNGRGESQPFEHTLSRGELDRIAEPFYVRAINRCRAALTEGNLAPEDIDRLLLVGGVTLSPGLRERLADPRHGLQIALDHSQDPTTVVALGAAIFASTIRMPARQAPPRPGEFTVELAYEPSVTTLTPTVAGQLRSASPVNWTGYTVTLDNSSGKPPFRSPGVRLSAGGKFVTEVRVEPGGAARFTIELTDAAGRRQKLSPDGFTITHGDVEFGGAVLTQSLGIGKADGQFAPMLNRGTRLPARTRRVYQTTIALHRSDTESIIRIPVVEGERSRAKRNREVAMLEIRPKDVRIDLPSGSDVEVIIEIDSSRLVSVIADVPLVQNQFEAKIDLSNVRPPTPAALQAELAEAESRLLRLRGSAEAGGSATASRLLATLDEERIVASARDQVRAASVDDGAAAAADQLLRDLGAVLDDVEDAVELPALLRTLPEAVDECRDFVTRGGNADDRRDMAELEARVQTVIQQQDPAAARKQLDRIREFQVDLMRKTGELVLYLFYALREELQHDRRATPLIREGERAIAAGDRQSLGTVCQRLYALRPPDAPPIGGVQ